MAKKTRANWLPAQAFYNLNLACATIVRAFDGHYPYLVGSALERRDYRDVDVRLILPDKEFDRLFRAGELTALAPQADALWSLMCASIAEWLRRRTGLPIDFQIQRMTQANEEHSGPRHALGLFVDYPGERPSENKPK